MVVSACVTSSNFVRRRELFQKSQALVEQGEKNFEVPTNTFLSLICAPLVCILRHTNTDGQEACLLEF